MPARQPATTAAASPWRSRSPARSTPPPRARRGRVVLAGAGDGAGIWPAPVPRVRRRGTASPANTVVLGIAACGGGRPPGGRGRCAAARSVFRPAAEDVRGDRPGRARPTGAAASRPRRYARAGRPAGALAGDRDRVPRRARPGARTLISAPTPQPRYKRTRGSRGGVRAAARRRDRRDSWAARARPGR